MKVQERLEITQRAMWLLLRDFEKREGIAHSYDVCAKYIKKAELQKAQNKKAGLV